MKTLLPILLAITLGACAHKATIYHAPSTTKLDASVQKLDASAERIHKAVTAAKATHAQTANNVDALALQVKDEGAKIEDLKPKLAELLRVAPPELRDQIDAAKMQVEAISEDHGAIAQRLEVIRNLQSTEGGQIEEANAADKQHELDRAATRAEITGIKAAMAKLAQDATTESEEKAKAENRVRELEQKNWIRRALEGLAAIGILVVGFLWFTGKLALTGAKAAAVIP